MFAHVRSKKGTLFAFGGVLGGMVLGVGSLLAYQFVAIGDGVEINAVKHGIDALFSPPSVQERRIREPMPTVDYRPAAPEQPEEEDIFPAMTLLCSMAKDILTALHEEMLSVIPDQADTGALRGQIATAVETAEKRYCLFPAAPEVAVPAAHPAAELKVDNQCEQYISARRRAQCRVYERMGQEWTGHQPRGAR